MTCNIGRKSVNEHQDLTSIGHFTQVTTEFEQYDTIYSIWYWSTVAATGRYCGGVETFKKKKVFDKISMTKEVLLNSTRTSEI